MKILSFIIGLIIGIQLGVQVLRSTFVPIGVFGPRNQAQLDKLNKLHASGYMKFRPSWDKDSDMFEIAVPVVIGETK